MTPVRYCGESYFSSVCVQQNGLVEIIGCESHTCEKLDYNNTQDKSVIVIFTSGDVATQSGNTVTFRSNVRHLWGPYITFVTNLRLLSVLRHPKTSQVCRKWCMAAKLHLVASIPTPTPVTTTPTTHTHALAHKRQNNIASQYHVIHIMMTSSNGNIFRVTGHLCGEFTGLRWIPRTKASDAERWCFLWSASE